jgi:hypothetical protein
MNITIRNEQNGRSTDYTPKQLHNDARWAAKGRGKLVRWWVEICTTGPAYARFCLRVEIKRADGLGEILNVAI